MLGIVREEHSMSHNACTVATSGIYFATMRLAPVSFNPPVRLLGKKRSTVLLIFSPKKPGDNMCRVLVLTFDLLTRRKGLSQDE